MYGLPIRKSTEASDVGIILMGLPLASSSCSPSELKREGESMVEDSIVRKSSVSRSVASLTRMALTRSPKK